MPIAIDPSYYDMLAGIESSNNPIAKASTSSASGLYQFLKATWIGLGGSWGSDPTQAFGGLVVPVDQQNAAIAQLTQQNAQALSNNNIPINNATLYAAHFLGTTVAEDALTADPGATMLDVAGANVIAANPFMANMSVAGFWTWLTKKTGASVTDTTNDLGTQFNNAILGGTQIDPGSFLGQTISGFGSNVVSPVAGAVTSTVGAAGDVVGSVKQAVTDAITSGATTVGGKLAAFWNSLVNSVKAWPGLIASWFSDHAFSGLIIMGGVAVILFSISSGLSDTPVGDVVKKGAAMAAMVA